MGALLQGGLCASTLEIVQQDGSCAGPEKSFSVSHRRIPAARLTTYHLGVREIPCIVAHRSPSGIRIELDPAFTPVLATHQSHRPFLKKTYRRKFSLVQNWDALMLFYGFFFLPAEGCVEVLLVGVFSVTLKSRPTMEWFEKAKNSRKGGKKIKEENMVTLVCSGNTQEVSGDQSNSVRFLWSMYCRNPVSGSFCSRSAAMFFNAYSSKHHLKMMSPLLNLLKEEFLVTNAKKTESAAGKCVLF